MNVEIVRKDTGGINPPVAKRLAEELVTRDNVDILAGFALTPNALAAAEVSAQAKKFMVVMNAATAIITTKSPYMTRTSFTVPQVNETLATWAEKNGDQERLYHGHRLRSGHRRRDLRFRRRSRPPAARLSARCAWRCKIRISPPMCSAPRISTRRRIFVMIPGGAQPGAFGKALAERGIDPKKTEVLGQAEIADEHAIASMGDVAEGIITSGNYDYNLDNRDEQRVRESLQRRLQP